MLYRTLAVAVASMTLIAIAACGEPGQITMTPHPASAAAPAAPSSDGTTALSPTQDTAAESSVEIAAAQNTLNGTNLRLADLISVAYRTPEKAGGSIPLLSDVRVTPAEPLPPTRYDVRIYVPNANAVRLRAALRQALRDAFGLVAHPELRQADALVLTAPTGRTKTAPATADPAPEPGSSDLLLTGDDLPLLAEQLEERLGQPVVNETGLRSSYRLRLRAPLKDGKAQRPTADAVRAALRDQLGLDLVPARRSVEFLVVERVTPTAR
jgi:uncharacterized protein (TIGR03435 family)